MNALSPILQVGDVLLSSDILTQPFCCDISRCGGRCCEEGDAGAPVTLEEIADIEEHLDDLWPRLSARAQHEIDRNGVAYTDPEGELVTSIICGGDCVFRGPEGCLLPRRPISCHLYPIRERRIGDLVGLNYHRWDICRDAVALGRRLRLPLYRFLREPLVRRFGEDWYRELETVADELSRQGMLDK